MPRFEICMECGKRFNVLDARSLSKCIECEVAEENDSIFYYETEVNDEFEESPNRDDFESDDFIPDDELFEDEH
ncbi:hypothetical protein [Evansella tamaricis]|uniref:Uncharacterized protein n=1 Tax=Evansella tamaricis TaxID=2069301 RepID=A0ABS6JGI4_9BACI|nr:hypothetical protein [Evansella tamaricis]MBU9712706.1 hypothetical protein [Evansella tamaricis]